MPEIKRKYKLGLALGGGGTRGLAHIGVLKVLERENIKIDLIVGTSMGAIVGAMYAQLQNAPAVESKALSFRDDFVEKKQWLKILSNERNDEKQSLLSELSHYVQRRYLGFKALTRASLESKESLYEPLQSVLINNNIEDNPIPFAAVSIDLVNGMPMVLSKGSIIDAVYASSAIEGVFPPLEYNGALLADGGPVNITPVEVAKQMGAEHVIAVDVHQKMRKLEKFANGLEIIMRANDIGLNRLTQIELSMAEIVIEPNVNSIHWANFAKIRECIRQGESSAEMMMPEIKALLTRKNWLFRIKDSIRNLIEAPRK